MGNRINVFLWGKGEILCKCQQPERPCYITVVRLGGQLAGAGFAKCECRSQQNSALVAVSSVTQMQIYAICIRS